MWEASDTVTKGRTQPLTERNLSFTTNPWFPPRITNDLKLQEQIMSSKLECRKCKVPKYICMSINVHHVCFHYSNPRNIPRYIATCINFFTVDNPISFEKQIDTFDFLFLKSETLSFC